MTTLFENAAVPTVPTVPPIDAPRAAKKHGWLPLLTALFLISYALMTMLIIEQGSTIESQRALIRELFRDSQELQAERLKAQQEKPVADATRHGHTPTNKIQAPSTQYQATQNPSTQIPSAQVQTPSTQAPVKQTPSSQAVPQRRTLSQTQKSQTQKQPEFQMPSKPASDLVDDVRTLNVI